MLTNILYRRSRPNYVAEWQTSAWVVVAVRLVSRFAGTWLSAVERSNALPGSHFDSASTRQCTAAPAGPVVPHAVHCGHTQTRYNIRREKTERLQMRKVGNGCQWSSRSQEVDSDKKQLKSGFTRRLAPEMTSFDTPSLRTAALTMAPNSTVQDSRLSVSFHRVFQ